MSYDYPNLNTSELVELAIKHGCLHAHRGLDRSVLEGLIEEEIDPSDVPPDPADEEREAMMIMKESWPEIYHQLGCAKEHYACWHCPAARAISCAQEECERSIMEVVKRGGLPNGWG